MFKWLFKSVARGIMAEIDIKELVKGSIDLKGVFNDLLDDEEVQKTIVEFTDELYARYSQKVLGTIGKMQAVSNGLGQEGELNLFNKKGQLDMKNLIGWGLTHFVGKQGQSEVGSAKTRTSYKYAE